MNEQKNKKGAASFWIPRQAVDALIKAHATASEIAAYLILAKHTPATGDYSTAGEKAVRIKAGMSRPATKKTIESLLSIDMNGGRAKSRQSEKAKKFTRLVYTADDWTRLTGEVLPHGPGQRSQIRYVLNTFGDYDTLEGDDMVWFGANLVAGTETFDRPMYALRQGGDYAARMLLLLYVHNAMEEWGGISPITGIWNTYKQTYCLANIGRTIYSLHHWESEAMTAKHGLFKPVIDAFNGNQSEAMEAAFWPAFYSLVSQGFIYEVVTVTTAQPGTDSPNENDFPLYELDARSLHGYKPKGEEGVAGETAMLARDLGYPVTDSDGQFYGKYAAVAPKGTPIRVIGIYRLRFRVSNPRNAYVSDTWSQIHERQQEAAEWIQDARRRAHLVKPEPPSSESGSGLSGNIFDDLIE
jgi:hypothetical protein